MPRFQQIGGSRVQDYRFYNGQQDQVTGADCPGDLRPQYEQVFQKQLQVSQFYPYPACNGGNGNDKNQQGGGPTPLPFGWFQPNPKLCYADERQYPWAGADKIPPQGCGCMFKAQQTGGNPAGAPLYLQSSKHIPLKYNFDPFANASVVYDSVNGHNCH